MGLLADSGGSDLVKTALEAGARQLCLRWDLVNREIVDRAHESDLHVVTWTVNDAGEMRNVIEAGVDGIMTDLPDRLRAVVEDMSSALPRDVI